MELKEHSAIPVVAVCVPTYNGARYLNDCLESIACQTFRNFEVVIVDDCSRDNSIAIAQRWAESDPRFRIHSNKNNLGLVENWNRCIGLSRAEWIKFLFQDDLMEPDCLATMLEAGKSGGGFVASSRRIIFDAAASAATVEWYRDHQRLLSKLYPVTGHLSSGDYSRAKLSRIGLNLVGEPSVVMINRQLFDRFGLFDPLLVQLCDSEMWNRLATNVGVDFVAQELVSFRVHQDSASEANQHRRYRAVVLDELVELHRLCKAPQLDAFRRVAKRSRELGRLRRNWIRRTWLAVRAAFAAAVQTRNLELLRDFEMVLRRLPGLSAKLGLALSRALTLTLR